MGRDSNDSHGNMGRNKSHERRGGTMANQGSAGLGNASHPRFSSQYHLEQPFLVPQIFHDDRRAAFQLPIPSYPSTSVSDSFGFHHPLPPIHGGNHNRVQRIHHPVNYIGIPTIPLQNRNPRGSGYEGSTISHSDSGFPPLPRAFGYGPETASHSHHQPDQHFSPFSQIRGYDNNSGMIHGASRNYVGAPRRQRDHGRSNSHNSRRSQNSPAVHRQAPRFQSSSSPHIIRVLPSAASVEIIDGQFIIDLVLTSSTDIQELPTDDDQEPLLPFEEQTNNGGSGGGGGLSEDLILTNLKTSALAVGKPTMCTICQDGFQENNRIGTLDCGHEYHADCITKWLKINNLCPLCKRTGLALDTRAD